MLARAPLARLLSAAAIILSLAAPAAAQPAPKDQGQGSAKSAPSPIITPEAKTEAPSDPVVARVDDYEIRSSQVIAQLRQLPAQTQKEPPEKLMPMVVEALVNMHLLDVKAAAAKTEDDPEVARRLAAAKAELMREVYLERLVAKDMTDAKLHEQYDSDIKKMTSVEEVNARHILVKTEPEAKAIIVQLEKGADFAKLAAEKSTDSGGKDDGGDLGWVTKDQLVPEFANALFALKKGEYTRTPVKTRFGWHVIKLVDRRTARPPSFEESKLKVAQQLQGTIIADEIKTLRAGAKIEIYGADGKPIPQISSQPTAPAASSEPAPKKN
jgi:peptidyl-prolyl cis-trans isomerase C